MKSSPQFILAGRLTHYQLPIMYSAIGKCGYIPSTPQKEYGPRFLLVPLINIRRDGRRSRVIHCVDLNPAAAPSRPHLECQTRNRTSTQSPKWPTTKIRKQNFQRGGSIWCIDYIMDTAYSIAAEDVFQERMCCYLNSLAINWNF